METDDDVNAAEKEGNGGEDDSKDQGDDDNDDDDSGDDKDDDNNNGSDNARVGGAATNGLPAPSKKRKSPNHTSDPDRADAPLSGERSKRLKLAETRAEHPAQLLAKPSSLGGDKSLLPAEIWHHIFTFCPPRSLGNLLSVNKLFNLYLDPSSSVRKESPVSQARSALALLSPNLIWRTSRRLFWPQMPGPLRSNTELAMWQLACSRRCQYCSRRDAKNQPCSSDPWRPGPGADGVVSIWPFASRSCASCIVQNSVKEIDLLLSPSMPSAIVPALPFVFLTGELHVLTPSMLEHGQLPPDLKLTKFFSSADVKALEQEFLRAKEMGAGTVDEWLKGLAGRGNDMRHESSKWEKWESAGGVAKMCNQLYPAYTGQPSSLATATAPDLSPILPPAVPQAAHSPVSAGTPQPFPPARPERTMEEVADLKAARKAEIERRAMLLDPPLPANILRHIPSFQAATHLITPLDDNAWDVLKPRLLSQRGEAEQREKEHLAEAKIKQEREERRHLETTLATTKEARDLIDKEWEDAQAPLRARVASFADEVIRDGWENGRRVTKDNCSKFAVDVLLYARNRFYAEMAKDVAAARAAGRPLPVDPPEGPFTQKMTLENMKWVFDTKVKPHTEPFRKELFYCSGCEGNYKTFGFEGVVQHFAAKHTSSLSVGSIVVHWRSEWPENPPFSAEARVTKALHYGQGLLPPFVNTVPSQNPFGYQPVTGPPATPTYPPHSATGYGPAPSYADHYHQPPPQPYHPQPVYSPFPPQANYGQQQPYTAPPSLYQPYQPTPSPYPPPVAAAEQAPGYGPPPPGPSYNYNYGPYQPNVQPVYTAPIPSHAHAHTHAHAPPPQAPAAAPIYAPTYQTQLDDVARNSREVWHALANIKEFPGSVRVFVTIHHVAKRFRLRFLETPPLSIFIDGLSNNKDMRPVRNINGLVCKACYLGLGNAASVEKDRKSYSLPQLANHFQTKHVEPMQNMQPHNNIPPLDWIVDMVLQPDLAAISRLRPALGENQRNLIGDAFPEAFYQHQPDDHGEAYPRHSLGGRDGLPVLSQATNGHGEHQGLGDSHSNNQPGETYGSGRSGGPHGATYEHDSDAVHPLYGTSDKMTLPLTPVEHERVRRGEGGHHSSQGSRSNREQSSNQNQRKKSTKAKRGNKGGGDSGRRLLEVEGAKDERKVRREEGKIRAMWAAERAEAARAFSASAKADQEERSERPKAPTPSQRPISQASEHVRRPPSRGHQAQLASNREEPDFMAALEMHLEQGRGRSPAAPISRQTPSDIRYGNGRGSAMSADMRDAPTRQVLHGDKADRSGSPTYEARFYQPGLPERERSPSTSMRQLEPVFYSRPAPVERHEARYDGVREQQPLPPLSSDAQFERPRPRSRTEDGAVGAAPSRSEYYRYPEDSRPQPRQPVEAYEIVHVIDQSGDYFIRRPVRHVPEQRYVYEEDRRTHRDAGYDRVYVPPPGPSDVSGPDRRRERRADPAYEEEYDPRFPAV
ncbi:hypothetical protein B0T19DRAFT_379634 [Cercophora scortea]|uniref:F-box domain-containing protein n=1 Tax=Cercophora scortea TaxID=314031 RepID=A0AAE0J5J3_9PEZI|nr:hypothetical protein B0T19DRAFT_379634 [Cercophora scortea]